MHSLVILFDSNRIKIIRLNLFKTAKLMVKLYRYKKTLEYNFITNKKIDIQLKVYYLIKYFLK